MSARKMSHRCKRWAICLAVSSLAVTVKKETASMVMREKLASCPSEVQPLLTQRSGDLSPGAS